MPRITLPITNGFYVDDSLLVAKFECTNWHPEVVSTNGVISNEILNDTPGINQRTTTGAINQANRGYHEKDETPYFLNGETLVRVDRVFDIAGTASYVNVSLGNIEGTGKVSMSDNGKQLMILVPGGKGYIVDESALPVFQEITDVDFTANGAPQYVDFVDSFFIVTTDTKKFIKSAANDGLSWNALDSGSAEADPDSIVAPIVSGNRLYITGSKTTEDFPNRPSGADFPFIRGGLVIKKGVAAPLSLVDVGASFMFVGGGVNETPGVWEQAGNSAQKVSNPAIDFILGALTDSEVKDISSFKLGLNGSLIICFIFPKATFCFDTVTRIWHKQTSLIKNNEGIVKEIAWRVSGAITAYGLVFCGDNHDGRIGTIEANVYTEYGELIHRKFSTGAYDAGRKITISSVELTVNSGAGDFDTVEPLIFMKKSVDNHEFNYATSESMGRVGEYEKQLIWTRQGSAKRFVNFEFSKSAPVKSKIVKLQINARSHSSGS